MLSAAFRALDRRGRESKHNLSPILQEAPEGGFVFVDLQVTEGRFHLSVSHALSLPTPRRHAGWGLICCVSYLRSIRCISMTRQARAQSVGGGGGGERTDDRVVQRGRRRAPRVSNVRVQKHTETHRSLYCTSMVRGVICKLM